MLLSIHTSILHSSYLPFSSLEYCLVISVKFCDFKLFLSGNT